MRKDFWNVWYAFVENSVQDIADALQSQQVEGLLVDAFTAGAEKHLFTKKDMIIMGIYYYSTSYGLVLSGAAANSADLFKSAIFSVKPKILDVIDKSSEKISVSNAYTFLYP